MLFGILFGGRTKKAGNKSKHTCYVLAYAMRQRSEFLLGTLAVILMYYSSRTFSIMLKYPGIMMLLIHNNIFPLKVKKMNKANGSLKDFSISLTTH